MSRSLCSSRRLLGLLFLLALGGLAQPAVLRADAKADIKTDLTEAAKLLKEKKFRLFLEKFAPVEELRMMREQGIILRIDPIFASNPEIIPTLLKMIEGAKAHEPQVDASEGLATFEFEEAGTAAEVPTPAKPVAEKKPGAGFGGDLKVVIAKAIAALKEKEYASLAEKVFPTPVAASLGGPGQVETLAAQMELVPELPKKMLEDLEALKALTPVLNAGKNVATYTLKGSDGPSRQIKFQKVGADWRFFDGTTAVQGEIAKLGTLKPPAEMVQIQMEKVGGNWRFVRFTGMDGGRKTPAPAQPPVDAPAAPSN